MTLNNSISNHFKNSEHTAISNASWLKRFLKAGAFLKLPAADLQHFVAQLQEIPVRCGQNIVTQCAKASHYYIIKEGRGKVTRRSNSQNVDLAVISTGEGFGEDAIISHQQRNATVTMLEAGSVMRIPANSFMSLIVSPIIKSISYENALAESFSRKVLIDVRSNAQHSSSGLRNSINIPLLLMRSNIQNLSANKTYILYCDNGQASAAAAFILTQYGFTAEYIEGGLASKSMPKTIKNKYSNTHESQIPSNSVLVKNEAVFEEVDIDIEAEIANIQSQLESLSGIEEAIENTNKANNPMEEESLLWTSIPLPETRAPEDEKEENENLSHGWVNDETLWENMLGYRSDPKIEQLLEAHEEITLSQDEKPVPSLPRVTHDTANTYSKRLANKKLKITQTKKSNSVLKYTVISIALVLSIAGAYLFFLDTETKQSFKQELHTFKNSITEDANNIIKDNTTFSTKSTSTIITTSVDQQNKTKPIDLQKKQAAFQQSRKDATAELQRKLALKKVQPIIPQANITIENTLSNTPVIKEELTSTENQNSDQTLTSKAPKISEAALHTKPTRSKHSAFDTLETKRRYGLTKE